MRRRTARTPRRYPAYASGGEAVRGAYTFALRLDLAILRGAEVTCVYTARPGKTANSILGLQGQGMGRSRDGEPPEDAAKMRPVRVLQA
jgi:hypothetical protein